MAGRTRASSNASNPGRASLFVQRSRASSAASNPGHGPPSLTHHAAPAVAGKSGLLHAIFLSRLAEQSAPQVVVQPATHATRIPLKKVDSSKQTPSHRKSAAATPKGRLGHQKGTDISRDTSWDDLCYQQSWLSSSPSMGSIGHASTDSLSEEPTVHPKNSISCEVSIDETNASPREALLARRQQRTRQTVQNEVNSQPCVPLQPADSHPDNPYPSPAGVDPVRELTVQNLPGDAKDGSPNRPQLSRSRHAARAMQQSPTDLLHLLQPPQRHSIRPGLPVSGVHSDGTRCVKAAKEGKLTQDKVEEPDLSFQWRPVAMLTKDCSYFLQTGLQFDVVGSSSPKPSSHGTTSAPLPLAFWGASQGLASCEPHQVAAMWSEMERQQSLQARLERRDLRLQEAKKRDIAARQHEGDGLRTAIWLILSTLASRDLWNIQSRLALYRRLQRNLVPRWNLWRYRQHLRRHKAQLLQDTALCSLTSPQLQSTGPLFANWTLAMCRNFIAQLQPVVFDEGEYICHQGDPSDLLYVLTEGEVDVIIRRPDSLSKARGKKSGLTVATIHPIKYVGEYGVFADEPRSATLYCTKRTVAWACTQECFIKYFKMLPTAVQQRISTSFQSNMAQIYQIGVAHLAATPVFKGAPLTSLVALIPKLEAVCMVEQTAIIEAGTPGTCMYFIAKGRCKSMQDGQEVLYGVGDWVGVRACMLLEPHAITVLAVNTVQMWRLSKTVLLDFMLSHPKLFLDAKQRLAEVSVQ